jgi:hypothetical protein
VPIQLNVETVLLLLNSTAANLAASGSANKPLGMLLPACSWWRTDQHHLGATQHRSGHPTPAGLSAQVGPGGGRRLQRRVE